MSALSGLKESNCYIQFVKRLRFITLSYFIFDCDFIFLQSIFLNDSVYK